MLDAADWQALWLSLQLALVTSVLLLAVCLPMAWRLGRQSARVPSQGRGGVLRVAVLTASSLPLVLPPTVLGFYLLLFFGAQGPVARSTGLQLAFSFPGIVLASMIYSLPFVLLPLINVCRAVKQDSLDAAASLGAGPWDRLFSIVLPQIWPGIMTAFILGFAHTLGEFGVIVMMGGSIPGETLVASVAIFEYVESGHTAKAHGLALVMVLTCVALLSAVYALDWWRQRRQEAT